MFTTHIITAVLSLLALAALALPKDETAANITTLKTTKNGVAVTTNTTCWVGPIHSVCHGHDNGCTPEGIYVTCQPSSNGGQMVYNDTCSPPGEPHGTLPGTCHCAQGGTGESSC